MTKVSRWELSSKEFYAIEKEFWKAVVRLGTPMEARSFFNDLLTRTERMMLAKRLQIARMLLEKENYASIKKRLHVTDVTIAKVSNWLHTFGKGYRQALGKN